MTATGEKLRVDFYSEKEAWGELSNFWPTTITYEGKTYKSSEHLYQAMKYMYVAEEAEEKAVAEEADAKRAVAAQKYAEVVRNAKTPYMSKILASLKPLHRYEWAKPLNQAIRQALLDGMTMDPKWEENKVQKMREVLRLKFDQDEHCRNVLLKTGNAILSEHTSRDKFWGDGGVQRKGENMLGRLLVEIREDLKAKEEGQTKKRKREEADEAEE